MVAKMRQLDKNIKINSRMQDNNQYHYDFSYSLAFDPLPELPQSADQMEKEFLQWCDIFATMNIGKDGEIGKYRLLFRVPVFRKLGLQLLKLCLLIHGDGQVGDKNSQIEKCRQLLYTHLQQLQQMLGKEQSKAPNPTPIILILYSLIERTIRNSITVEDQFVLFHTIYWEMKGQLVNKQNMENAIERMFNVQEFHKFMYWDRERLLACYGAGRGDHKREEPLTFRASIANRNRKEEDPQLYQSFRQVSGKPDGRGLYKQNIANNFMMQATKRQPQQLHPYYSKADGVNMDTFRKKAQLQPSPELAKPFCKPIPGKKSIPFIQNMARREEDHLLTKKKQKPPLMRDNPPILSVRQPRGGQDQPQFQYNFQFHGYK